MFSRKEHHNRRQKLNASMSKAMGNGCGRRVSESVANYLLDITIFDVAYHASNAILSKGGGLQYARKAEVSFD